MSKKSLKRKPTYGESSRKRKRAAERYWAREKQKQAQKEFSDPKTEQGTLA